MMNLNVDNSTTIVAISTPIGTGGIAVIRVSGPDALIVADRVWKGIPFNSVNSHTAHYGYVLDENNDVLDEAVATVFIAPKSFTGQDTVEFSVHGSKFVQRELLASLVKAGASLAQPGEFTRRAFASGKIQLTQAEAIADIISSNSRAAHRLALSQLKGNFENKIQTLRQSLIDLLSLLELELDFSEEDVEFADRTQLRCQVVEIQEFIKRLLQTFRTGNAIKNGIPVAIVGPTNAGKSSLLNALLEDNRAIVSDIHGTTRDTVEETIEIGDYLFRIIDTAGLRDTVDPIEQLGIERSLQSARQAHIILSLVDLTNPSDGLAYAKKVRDNINDYQKQLVIFNKSDATKTPYDTTDGIVISAKTGEGIENLRKALTVSIENCQEDSASLDMGNDVMITNQRHAEALQKAYDYSTALLKGMDEGLPSDLLAMDARAIIASLSELTGDVSSTDVLNTIFSRFCIGK